jgi:hypothetical protein
VLRTCIFRLLAQSLMMNLPKNGKLIVTDVTGSLFVPMKVTMLVTFRDRAVPAVPALGVRRARLLPAREEKTRRADGRQWSVPTGR